MLQTLLIKIIYMIYILDQSSQTAVLAQHRHSCSCDFVDIAAAAAFGMYRPHIPNFRKLLSYEHIKQC